jgi:acyl-CoA thioester hydrolase
MDDVTYKGAIHPRHCDHVGHMNIMWYVGKFDEANWNLFSRLGMTPPYLRERERGMAALQQNISYKRELLAGDIVEVRSRVLEIRERSMRIRHEMWNAATHEFAASCEVTGVHLDQRERKAVPFTDEVHAAALAEISQSATPSAQQSDRGGLTRGSACRGSRRHGPPPARPRRRRPVR